jgi:hypothetical protein
MDHRSHIAPDGLVLLLWRQVAVQRQDPDAARRLLPQELLRLTDLGHARQERLRI